MHRAVLRNLLSHAVNSAREEEPSEIGGVLWGKTFGDDSLVISEATFVNGSGLLFNDGSLDRRNIETTIHRPPPEPSLAVLGYFRSQTREDVCLTARDRSLIEEHFDDPDSIFLVIRPVDMGICMAEFFFWLNGRLQTESSDLQVPLMVPEDTPGNDSPGNTVVGRELSQADSPQPSAIRNGPSRLEPTGKPANRSAWLGSVLTVFVLALMGAIAAYFGSPVVRARLQTLLQHSPDTGFDLQVARTENGEISLNWNQFDPNIIRAQGATLNIIDGSRLSKLNLGYAQLRSGKVTYSPQSDDVEFRLEVDSENGERITKSVHALAPPSETLARGGSPSAEASGPRPQVNKFSRDKSGKGAPRAAQGNDDILVEVPLEIGPNPNDPPKVVLEVTTLVRAAPKSTAPDVYTPPFVLEEMMPETTRFGQFEQVSVQVDIDPSGHVTAAWATVNGNESQSPAAAVAVSAAKRWIFHPAALNGKPVPSEYTIVFSFHPHPV